MVCPFPKPSTLPNPGCTCKSVYDRKYSTHSIFTRSKLISAATSRVGESKHYPGVFFNNKGIYQETNLIYFPLRKFLGQPEKQFSCGGTGTNVPDIRRVVLHKDMKAFVGVMEHPGEAGCPAGHKGCFKPCTVYTSVKPAATGITVNRDAVLPQAVEAIPTCVFSYMILLRRHIFHIRPHLDETNGSRLLSDFQASKRRISTQVGDHWGIPAVVCF
jgi:hypothetical protein